MLGKQTVETLSNLKFGKLIGAHIVKKPGSIIDIQKIKNVLGNALPKYCIPEKIDFVESITRTSAGKIDYKSLSQQYNED